MATALRADALSIMNPAHVFFFAGATQAFLMPADIAAAAGDLQCRCRVVLARARAVDAHPSNAGLVASFVRRARSRVLHR